MENKGLFGSLFDLSFTELITPRIIKVLFILATVVMAVAAVMMLMAGISAGGGRAFASIIFVPLGFIMSLLSIRVWLEVMISIFRIEEHTARLVKQGEKDEIAAD